MKPFPWKCGECRERAIYPAVLETYTTEMDHDGKTYPISVSSFEVMQCRNCGEIVLDDDANRRLSDALRSAVGLLQPSEIRARREKLGLTQKALAAYLQIAEATLSRWETGAQIQQRVMDKFLRVFFQSRQARSILGVPTKERLPGGSTIAAPITIENVQTVASFGYPYLTNYQLFGGLTTLMSGVSIPQVRPIQNQATEPYHFPPFLKSGLWLPASSLNITWMSEPVEIRWVATSSVTVTPEKVEKVSERSEEAPVALKLYRIAA